MIRTGKRAFSSDRLYGVSGKSGGSRSPGFKPSLGSLGLVLLLSTPAAALDLTFHDGRVWGMLYGYGFQHAAWEEETGEQVELSFLYPTMAMLSYIRGPLQVNMDIQVLLASRMDQRDGILGGGGPVFRILYDPGFLASPYLHLGVGVLYTDMDLKGMGTRENFFQEVGMGVQREIREKLTLGGEYRVMHVSNAGLSKQNFGFNTHMVLLGIWYAF